MVLSVGLRNMAVSHDVYGKLISFKKEGELISDIIVRLSNHPAEKLPLMFAGRWLISDEKGKSVFDEISDWRVASYLP
jgi:predicted CopG family antitoxin